MEYRLIIPHQFKRPRFNALNVSVHAYSNIKYQVKRRRLKVWYSSVDA